MKCNNGKEEVKTLRRLDKGRTDIRQRQDQRALCMWDKIEEGCVRYVCPGGGHDADHKGMDGREEHRPYVRLIPCHIEERGRGVCW